ncbi:hypothetical protein K493DRAFT_362925 [Basidiobolus meristosporus CBS 931.73]|uniref:DNA mismatch repair proteins mutS family domain-containing protein n=1 Tax=Basidiobolus meristosporus CBS 931.73 TaxID=1314790 RepID=A0A1Y1WY69_9FUNG|nr:hypothetical protein K493DRAFT_362925 [Basidiobolus meristosporus CBS 931.73]|eukprot:ORX78500.1 hypothetical protein K493DRAFT_362925 [Basidiobolus meristosporus CBS 931.73]
MSKESVVNEYFNFLTLYQHQYGQQLVVLMQVGSFYEIYGVDNNTEKLGNPADISELLNIILTKKNKKLSYNNRSNPLLVGFPCVALKKYIPLLLEHNYTLVIIDQKGSPPNITREVTNIISPSTYVDVDEPLVSRNYLVLLFFDTNKKLTSDTNKKLTSDTNKKLTSESDKKLISESDNISFNIGISAIDVITGKNTVYESYSTPEDHRLSFDHILSFLKQYHPREVVFCSPSKYLDFIKSLDLVSYLELYSDDILFHYIDATPKALQLNYQNELLGNIFPHKTMLSNIEFLDLERKPLALISYVLLIEFLYLHNPMLVRKLSPPEIFLSSNHLLLATNTIDQLDLIHFSKSKSSHKSNQTQCLLDIIDLCSTKMGKRLLKKRLLSPVTNPHKLEHRYRQLDDFSSLFEPSVSSPISTPSPTLETSELDKLEDIAFALSSHALSYLSSTSRKYVDKKLIPIKVDYSPRSGYYLSVTNSFATKLKSSLTKSFISNDNITFKSDKLNTKISSNSLTHISDHILSLDDQINKQLKSLFLSSLKHLSSYKNIFRRIELFVAEFDVIKSNYKISRLYNFCRPVVKLSNKSYFKATDLRHPLIERLQTNLEYVPNDITIGTNNHDGIILYSMNSCGKTSLLKACGLSIILAQMGSFVPASSFEFSPYKSLMTRILSEDNILKGQSSFVAEMSDLRNILKRADPYTLVLADEITHGTEHISGSAIFASSVMTLAEQNISFMFTTHLHNIYKFIKDIPNVKVFHLSVNFEHINSKNVIIFERKIKEGPCDSIYGLEVCEFLNMDYNFLQKAFQIRADILSREDKTCPTIANGLLNQYSKYSRYNKDKLVYKCQICNYVPTQTTDLPIDVHHIQHQHTSDNNGMIDHRHKNSKSNLVALCKNCHVKTHQNKLQINGYASTTEGLILNFEQ